MLGKSKRLFNNRAKQSLKIMLCSLTGILVSIGIFAASEGDGYLFLLGHNTKAGSAVLQIMQTISTTLGLSSTTSTDPNTGQDGVNTLLIAKMNEGYAKDYLSICLENEEGKLDNTSRKVYVPLTAIVGINISETKFYSVGDGVTLPISDIPADGIKKGKYGIGKYSLYTWNANCTPHGTGSSGSDLGGQFRYTPEPGSWTGIATTSKYNKGTHTPGGKGDAYLMPDAVAGLNYFLAKGLGEIGLSVKDLESSSHSDMITAVITSYEHNLGSGLKKSLYGVCMVSSDSKIKNGSSKETRERLDAVCTDISSAVSDLSDKQISELAKHLNKTAAIPGEICLIRQGWKISSEMKTFLLKHSSNAIACWNIVNPNDKISNASQLESKLSSVTTSITSLTGYSASKCDSLYGTVGGSYAQAIRAANSRLISQREYGTIFKVMEGSTDALGEKGTKKLIAIPGIPMQHIFTSTAFGSRIAKKMMLYAGVDASLVNSTNLNSAGSEQTITNNSASFKTNSSVVNDLKAHGCNVSKLDNARYHVLAAAMKMQGSTYIYGASHGHGKCTKLDHSSYDCSSFVHHAVNGSGIKELASLSFPDDTSSYPSSSNAVFNVANYSNVNSSGMMPGDICCRRGHHVLLYVGSKKGRMQTLEAMGTNYQPNGWHDRSGLSGYAIYRIKKYYTVDSF